MANELELYCVTDKICYAYMWKILNFTIISTNPLYFLTLLSFVYFGKMNFIVCLDFKIIRNKVYSIII